MNLIQAADLGALSFTNANTAGLGGITLRTDAGSTFAAATANFPSYSASGSDPVTAPARTPAVHYNTTSDSIWVWNATAGAWEKSGRNYQYDNAKRESVSQVLTAADNGVCLVMRPTVAGITVELPLRSLTSDGAIFDIVNTGSFDINVLVSSGSTDTIVAGTSSVTAYIVLSKSSVRIVRIAGAPWHVTAAAGLTYSAGGAGFAGSLVSPNGWQQLPSGLIMQWGQMLLFGAPAYTTITLPVAYPNNNFGVYGNAVENVTGVTSEAVEFGIRGLTSFEAIILSGIQAENGKINWFSIGN